MIYGFFSNGACFFFRKFLVSTQNPSDKSKKKSLTIPLILAALWVSSVLLMCKVPAVMVCRTHQCT